VTLTHQPQHASAPAPTSGLARLLALVGPLAIAVAVQSAANLVFHGAVGRWLDVSSYGALGALLAVITMLAVPLGALQAAASALTATHGRTAPTVRRALSRSSIWALGISVVVALASPVIASFFHVSRGDAALLAPFIGVSVVLAIARGLLLGDGRTKVVAASYVVSAGVRLGPGLVLAAFYGITGALVGTLIGEISALAVTTAASLRKCVAGVVGALQVRPVAVTTFAITGLFAVSTADLLLARHFLPGAASGIYVAAATIGKTVLAIPAAVVSAIYPRFVAAWKGTGRRVALRNGLIVIAAPAFAVGIVVAAAPNLVTSLLYGTGSMPGSAPVVRALALIAATTSIVSGLTYAALARHGRALTLPWLGAVLEVVLISFFHSTPLMVAACSGIALAPTLVALAITELRAWTR